MRRPDPQTLLLISFAVTLGFTIWLHLNLQPRDFGTYANVDERKAAFITYLCPLIEEQNASARADRDLVLQAHAELRESGDIGQAILDLGKKYSLTVTVPPDVLVTRLLRRVDQLPDALVLAQAAIESGWGTSELYTRTHNLFGRRCFYASDCYSPPNSTIEYRRFPSAGDAVAQYFRDLNTLMPYKRLRDLRAQYASDPRRLAEGLRAYSSRGTHYVRQVRRVIDDNNLRSACGVG